MRRAVVSDTKALALFGAFVAILALVGVLLLPDSFDLPAPLPSHVEPAEVRFVVPPEDVEAFVGEGWEVLRWDGDEVLVRTNCSKRNRQAGAGQ